MKIQIKKTNYKTFIKSKGKQRIQLYPIASRYEDGKLQAFSIMTELKGK